MVGLVELLCFCAPEDQQALNELIRHLGAAGLPFSTLGAGERVMERLERARAVLLLLSADFFTGRGDELELILRRWRKGDLIVLPVLLRPVRWEECPLAALQPLPAGGKAVSLWESRDQAWVAVIDGLRPGQAPSAPAAGRWRWALTCGALLVAGLGWGLWPRAPVSGQDRDLAPPEQRLGGTVHDEHNRPVAGVRLVVLEHGRETVTDGDGVFQLSVSGPPQELVTLRVDQGAGQVRDFPVTLSTTNLCLNVQRRRP